ncbi:MAG: zinc ribbon domain-containing protein [Planctomycetota bacterium]|jgi:hypothetical protein
MDTPEGPICCQSCSMPLDSEEKFGTEEDGSASEYYCRFCYQNGQFMQPDMTVDEMINTLAGFRSEKMGITVEEAKEQLAEFIPTLWRWQHHE